MLYSQEEAKKDVEKAYRFLNKAVVKGITFFDQMNQYFKANFAILGPVFIEMKKPPSTVNVND